MWPSGINYLCCSDPSVALDFVAATRRTALCTISRDISAPTTAPEGPITGNNATAASPVPVDMSNTMSSDRTPAAAITLGTNNRDQRPVNLS